MIRSRGEAPLVADEVWGREMRVQAFTTSIDSIVDLSFSVFCPIAFRKSCRDRREELRRKRRCFLLETNWFGPEYCRKILHSSSCFPIKLFTERELMWCNARAHSVFRFVVNKNTSLLFLMGDCDGS